MADQIVQLLEETIGLADVGQWDQIYEEAEKQGIQAYDLTKYLWESYIHPETEGLKGIPVRFAAGLVTESVVLGNSVKSISNYAFLGCRSLTSLTYNGTKEQWKRVKKGSDWLDSSRTVHCIDGDLSLLEGE